MSIPMLRPEMPRPLQQREAGIHLVQLALQSARALAAQFAAGRLLPDVLLLSTLERRGGGSYARVTASAIFHGGRLPQVAL